MEIHISLVGRENLSGEIYRQIRQAIVDGRLPAGSRLPPTRELARQLSVSRTTVTVAYDRLIVSGFVTTRVGAGTFVRDQIATNGSSHAGRTTGTLQPRSMWDAIPILNAFERAARYDLRSGVPDVKRFPHDDWRRLVAAQHRARAVGQGFYGEPAGYRGLRDAIAAHIGVSRGIEGVTGDDVVIANGTQQCLDVLARVLLAPGDRIAVEDPSYPPPRWLFESLGIEVVGIPVDRDGLDVNALPDGVRVVYTTPSHHFPLGVTLSLERRLALLDWAERNNAAIIEDDYDSEFRFGGRPLEPLRTLDRNGRVIYVGTFSKTMLPELRIGFIIVPPSLRDAAHRAKFTMDWHSPLPAQRALAEFIRSGGFARHVRRMNRLYQDRHDIVMQTLDRDFADFVEVMPSNAGLHIGTLFHEGACSTPAEVQERAASRGVAIHEMEMTGVHGPARPGLIVGYGAIEAVDLREGLRRLRFSFEEAKANERSIA